MCSHRLGFLKCGNRDGIVVLTITSPHLLDIERIGSLCRMVREVIRRRGAKAVVLDWQNVKYVAGEVAGPLLGLRRFLAHRSGRLLLCGLLPRVAVVFRLVGLVGQDEGPVGPLETAPDVPAALARVQTTWPRHEPNRLRRSLA